MTRTKHKDLQPWLDYFAMLHNYEQRGLLELHADKHEAYVTQPALHAMTPGDDPTEQLRTGAIADTLRRLRTYAAFCAQQGSGYFTWPFALHVVQDEPPHDLLYTMLITQQRSWRTAWQTREKIETIDYQEKVKSEE